MPPTAAPHAWVSPVTLHDPVLTPTIRLEPLERRHAPDFLAAADPELFRHSSQSPMEWSVWGFEEEMEKVMAIPGVVAFAMVLAGGPDRGRAIGRTTFMDIKPEHRGLEIGRTWITRSRHGTRVNPEAKYLMLRHAFETLTPPAIRVQITTNGTNLHSQAAIAKLGAVREGTLRNSRIMPAAPPVPGRAEPLVRDWVIFSILAEEWPGVKQRLEERLKTMG
jgi:RimJ/RimL family protein N-acetyltransferase